MASSPIGIVNREASIGSKGRWASVLAAYALVSWTALGDVSSLGVVGPHSGAGFSNLGAVSKEPVATVLTKAEVLLEIQGRQGDDLAATCHAVFDFDPEPGPAQAGQTLLVAFPVTGFGGEAVKISQFAVLIDGVALPELLERRIRLYAGKEVSGEARSWTPVEADPKTFQDLGFYGGSASTSFMQAYAWTQKFQPGKHCRMEVNYLLTLHPQSLAYAKKVIHNHSPNVVPFDAMLVGPTAGRGFFLDYILRSGGTWKGPIGHETVTLRAAKSSGLTLPVDHMVTFGRRAFWQFDDFSNGAWRYVAGFMNAEGVRNTDEIVWEIDHEKPQQDILVEIPESILGGKSP